MTTAEALQLIHSDEEFVAIRRFEYSISKVEERFPEGAPDHVIASALMITQDDVQAKYDEAVEKLRELMGVEL